LSTVAVTELFRDLEQGGRAVAATRRLTRQVEQRFAGWKARDGARAWPTPRVRALDDWLREIWQACFEDAPGCPRLLSEDQEQLMWEQVIRRDAAGEDQAMLQPADTARTARQSWNRIHEWRLDWQRMRVQRSADTDAFLRWAGAVRQTLDERRWLTAAELPGYLAAHPDAWLPHRAGVTWWLGFTVMPPATGGILAMLVERGLEQKRFDAAAGMDADVRIAACADSRDEWHHVALWARDRLTAAPDTALGVVCPDLHRRRDDIEEVLEDVLYPEPAWWIDAPRPFHLSLGRPLSEYPVAGAALDLLRWTGRRIPFELVSRTLRSPYIGGVHELDARIELELALRARGQESFTLRFLEQLAAERPGLEQLAGLLGGAGALEMPARADPGAWSARFSDWLRAFGWPGGRALNSHEYQALGAWREQLSRFAALNTVQDAWTLADALNKLSDMASGRVLQVHDDQAPLQIMGASEAAGLWFDELWLADMSDESWPPPAQPDPFIPVSMQKDAGMPHASAQSSLAHTRARTDGLLAGAPRVTVSYAADSSEAPTTVSPLFERYEAIEGGASWGGRIHQLLARALPLDAVDDRRAPPPAGRELRGGVALVADQARCPFRALTHHRLRARDLDQVVPGLDPMTRGNLAHDALKRFWDRLRDRDSLERLDPEALETLAAECAAGALERQFADSAFQRRYLALERARLSRLLTEWAVLEKQRPWFRVIATEQDMELALGGVRIRVRADRIDELADGRRMIIDYKTGQLAAVADWAHPRMTEPQLPMYALSVGEDVAGLAFAAVRQGECELRGITDDVDALPSLRPVTELQYPDMATLREWWRSALDDLAAGYRKGEAPVDPRDTQTCRYCDAMPVCRIFERRESVG